MPALRHTQPSCRAQKCGSRKEIFKAVAVYEMAAARTLIAWVGADPRVHAAGWLIIGGHACVAGQVTRLGQLQPLDGHIPIGSNGRWLDAGQTGIDSVKTRLNSAVAKRGRWIIRAHPQYVGVTNYITAAQMDAFLASLAARRDTGELWILPFREWNIATL